MNKVNNSKNSDQYSSGSEGAPLKRADPEGARRFDEILSRDRHGGGRERNMKDEDSLEDLGGGDSGTGNDAEEPVTKSSGWAGSRNGPKFESKSDPASTGKSTDWSQDSNGPEFLPHGAKRPEDSNAAPHRSAPDNAVPYGSNSANENAPFAVKRDNSPIEETFDILKRSNARKADEEAQRELNKKLYSKVTENAPFGGDTILSSLRASSEFHQAEAVKAEKRAGIIKSVGREVAERILASSAALNAKQEVRISLKNEILPNTEVIVSKDGKMLSVDFYTSASESASLLASKQAELRAHLMDTLHDVNDVDVNVYRETSETRDGDSHDGRSRDEYVGDYDPDSDNGKGK
ncbi:MAG: flagellar hook-length control protein FliK [Puniceicoccales bacterium]|jgi:hypothetical protein|nr:flagellar hook-length control protein FliK [Puniceicoccales bacterium]